MQRSFRRLVLALNQRDETDRYGGEEPRSLGRALEHAELLVAPAEGQRNAPALPELLQEGRRHLIRGRRDRNSVVGRVLREAEPAVADVHVDALVARGGERCPRALGKLGNPLDRMYFARQLREHGRLIAGAGADIEDALVTIEREALADEGDDERLRDRLSVCKRQRRILVREPAQVLGHEELARHARHRVEHALIVDAAVPKLFVDPGGACHAACATATPKCARTSALISMIEAGGSPSPIVSIGTSESAGASDPWLPPPRWLPPARSANSQPGAADTSTSPAFGLRNAASARARPSRNSSSSVMSSSPSRR